MGFQCSLWYLSDLLWPTGTRQVGIAACSLSLVEALLSTHCYLWSTWVVLEYAQHLCCRPSIWEKDSVV